MSKPWHLYILECAGGRLYTGITVDVEARYKAHCSGKGAKFTRAHPPEKLLLAETYPNRREAAQAEYRIKQLTAAEKRALIATGTTQTHFSPAQLPKGDPS